MNYLFGKVFLRTNLEAGISVINFIFKLAAFTTSRVLTWPMNYGWLYHGLARLELLRTKTKQYLIHHYALC